MTTNVYNITDATVMDTIRSRQSELVDNREAKDAFHTDNMRKFTTYEIEIHSAKSCIGCIIRKHAGTLQALPLKECKSNDTEVGVKFTINMYEESDDLVDLKLTITHKQGCIKAFLLELSKRFGSCDECEVTRITQPASVQPEISMKRVR